MNLLKWITHPVYLLLIIIVVAIYLNRDALFAGPPTAVDTAAEQTEPTAPAAPPKSERTDTADGRPETPATAPASPQPATVAEAAVPATSPTGEPAAAAADREALREAEQAALAEVPAPVSAPETVPTEPAAGRVQGDELWRAARVAAWRGDLSESEKLYRRFAEQRPESIDAFGELGNVLMRAGNWGEAAEAFAEAARRAKSGGQPQVAWHLHSVVAGLDPERAAALRKQLAKADTSK